VERPDLRARTRRRLDFELDVPADAVLVRFELRCDAAELELYGNPSTPIGAVDEALYAVTEPDEPRAIVFDGLGPDPVAGTTWYFQPCSGRTTLPRIGGQRVEHARRHGARRTFGARVDGELTPACRCVRSSTRTSGGFRTVPRRGPGGCDARCALDLFEPSSDLDLYARPAAQILARESSVALAENTWGHETLVLDARFEAAARGRRLVRGRVRRRSDRRSALPFSILARVRRGRARAAARAPEMPGSGAEASSSTRCARGRGARDRRRRVAAARILTPDGWILTNEHVVGDDPEAEIVVSLRSMRRCRREESLRAQLVRAGRRAATSRSCAW
jgi:hypothetical protein